MERYRGRHKTPSRLQEIDKIPSNIRINRREILKNGAVLTGWTVLTYLGIGRLIGPSLRNAFEEVNSQEFSLTTDIRQAAELETKDGHLFPHPMARTNMSLIAGKQRLNPDTHFYDEEKFTRPAHWKLRRELRQPRKLKDKETGQKLTALTLNWDRFEFEGERPVVFLSSYNNALSGQTTNYRLQELARQTGAPVFALSYPEVEGDEMTLKQRESFERGEGFAETARAMLRIMKGQGIREVDISAQSMGARVAASLARYAHEFGIKIKKLHLVEPTGVEEFSLQELRDRFLSEAKYLALAQSRPYDPEMRLAGDFDDHPVLKTAKDLRWLISTVFTNDPSFLYAKELAKKTLQEDLEAAFATNPQMTVKIISGSLSSICPHDAVREMVADMKSKGYKIFWGSYPGEHHTVLESAKRYGNDAARALDRFAQDHQNQPKITLLSTRSAAHNS